MDARHVDTGRRDAGDAPLGGVLRHFQRVCVFEERFGRDAAPDEARAAQLRCAFNDSDFEPELRRADGGDVTTCARTNYNDIEFVCHGNNGN